MAFNIARNRLPIPYVKGETVSCLSGGSSTVRQADGHSTERRKDRVIGPDDVLPEMVDAPHRGQSEDEPVELIVFYAGTALVPLTAKSEAH